MAVSMWWRRGGMMVACVPYQRMTEKLSGGGMEEVKKIEK
jgi:hypothetical protein